MDMQFSDPGAGPASNGSGGGNTRSSGRAPGALARLRRPERSGERLRWGLTGLAAIFLIVMLAAARLGPAGNDQQTGAGEPLAVLGVAPGPATRPQAK
jgi:hypothetical protein